MIRIAVIGGSLADRVTVQRILSSDPDMLLVGTSNGGNAAVELVFRTRPDVVTLVVGVDAAESYPSVRQIMGHCPTRILLLIDAAASTGDQPARALAAGALDAMEKPPFGCRLQDVGSKELLLRVKLLSRVPVITHVAGKLGTPGRRSAARLQSSSSWAAVAIAASTGGPMALTRLLSRVPADLPAPLLVVQHIAVGFVDGLVSWFQDHCVLKVQLAAEGMRIEPGLVLVGPDSMHMTVGKDGLVELDDSPAMAGIRPSGDRLLESVAEVYGSRAIGVVLTGMGNDGALGAIRIKQVGGRVIVQDEASSAIFGMPRATIDAGAADEVLSIDAIAGKLVEWVGRDESN